MENSEDYAVAFTKMLGSSKLCRVCLKQRPEMESLFRSENLPKGSANFAEVIMTCASVQINKDDSLPSYICRDCLKDLLAAVRFKLLCENSDGKLRKLEDAKNEKKRSTNASHKIM